MHFPRLIHFLSLSLALVCWGCHSHDHEHDGHDHDDHAETEAEAHGHEPHAAASDAEAHAHGDEIIPTQAAAKAAGVVTEKISAAPFQPGYLTSGQLLSAQGDEQTVVATAAGVLTLGHASLAEGAQVRAGQTLGTVSAKHLPDGDPVAKARIAYETAKSEYERAQKLAADRIVAQKDLEQARLAFENARIALDALLPRAAEGGMRITSPLTGYVKTLLARTGDYVEVGSPVAVVTQCRRLQLRADVPADMLQRLATVQSANFRLAGSDRLYCLSNLHGRLLSRSRSVADGAGFASLTFELDYTGDMLPGAYAEVWVLGAQREGVLSVPRTALTEEMGHFYIYIKTEPDAYVKREVQLCLSDGQRTEVTAGLTAGEEVVVRGAGQVRMASSSAMPPAHSHNH